MEPETVVTLPSGTVTFLFTDIEDSSWWWERQPNEMREALARHDTLAADVVRTNAGAMVKHLGDGCWAAFDSPAKAALAAMEFQRRHQQTESGEGLRLDIRIGLHTGEVEPTGHDYFGPVVNRAARIVDLANGNQIVCSSSTATMLREVELRSEGIHELRGIGTDEVFMVLGPDFETTSQPLRLPVAPTNLPRPRTSLVGREEDIDSVLSFVQDEDALVTLLGPGGVGKTRLAVEVGSRVAESFRGQVHFCDLVPVSDADDVAELVAEIVGARRQPGMSLTDSIADYLGGRQDLVVLDNCEHIIDAARYLVERLIGGVDVYVLATSREPLGLAD